MYLAVRDEDEDEYLRVYHAEDFTPEALDLIKDLADSYRKIRKMFKMTRYPGYKQEIRRAFSKLGAAKQRLLDAFKYFDLCSLIIDRCY